MAVIWNDALNNQFRSMRLAKTPVAEMAAHFGTSVGAIYAHARILKAFVMTRRDYTEEEVSRLRVMVADQCTDAEMCAALQRSLGSIRWKLENLGLIGTRCRPTWTEADSARIRGHAAAGLTTPDIALLEGISPNRARARLRQAGAIVEKPKRICKSSRTNRGRNARAVSPLSGTQITMLSTRLGHVSLRNIAREMHMSVCSLKARASASGVVIDKSMRRAGGDLTKDVLEKLIAQEMGITAVARHLNRDVRTVRRAAEDFGVIFPSRGKARKVGVSQVRSRAPSGQGCTVLPFAAKSTREKKAVNVPLQLPRSSGATAPLNSSDVVAREAAVANAVPSAAIRSTSRFILPSSEVESTVARFLAWRRKIVQLG